MKKKVFNVSCKEVSEANHAPGNMIYEVKLPELNHAEFPLTHTVSHPKFSDAKNGKPIRFYNGQFYAPVDSSSIERGSDPYCKEGSKSFSAHLVRNAIIGITKDNVLYDNILWQVVGEPIYLVKLVDCDIATCEMDYMREPLKNHSQYKYNFFRADQLCVLQKELAACGIGEKNIRYIGSIRTEPDFISLLKPRDEFMFDACVEEAKMFLSPVAPAGYESIEENEAFQSFMYSIVRRVWPSVKSLKDLANIEEFLSEAFLGEIEELYAFKKEKLEKEEHK